VMVKNTAGIAISTTAALAFPKNFVEWATAHGVGGGQFSDDSNGDGISDGQAYFHNLDPNSQPVGAERASALPGFSLEPATGQPAFMVLTYRRSARATGVDVHYQAANALGGNWGGVVPDVTEEIGTDSITGDPIIRVKFALEPGSTEGFLRLQFSE
ncbi:MAG: hypothetical protein ABI680_21265, partial [Chthoniobacteraceae bacterium]